MNVSISPIYPSSSEHEDVSQMTWKHGTEIKHTLTPSVTVFIRKNECRMAATQHTENSPREPGTVLSDLLHVKTVEIVYPSTQ